MIPLILSVAFLSFCICWLAIKVIRKHESKGFKKSRDKYMFDERDMYN